MGLPSPSFEKVTFKLFFPEGFLEVRGFKLVLHPGAPMILCSVSGKDERGYSASNYMEKSKRLQPNPTNEMPAFSGKKHFTFFTYKDFYHKTSFIQNIWKSETYCP